MSFVVGLMDFQKRQLNLFASTAVFCLKINADDAAIIYFDVYGIIEQ
jgi:hypothetical protein